MAEQAAVYHHGEQDIREQRSTFHMVLFATKWGSLYLAATLLLLILWFCTSAGFVTALVSAAVLLALGIFFLGDRRKTH